MKPQLHLPIREVSSPANPTLKLFRRALAEGSTREGWLAVEGPHLLEEALAAGAPTASFPHKRESTLPPVEAVPAPKVTVHSLLLAKSAAQKFRGLLARLPEAAEIVEIPDKLFARISPTESPQGLAALVEVESPSLDALLGVPSTLLIVACGVQEPGNMGTMVRSAQALGGKGVLALKSTVSAFNPKAVRASAGAIFRLPVVQGLEPRSLFDRLRHAGVRIIAAYRRGPVGLAEADLRGPVAVLIGREGTGLPEEVAREATQHVAIPLRPGADSINAATAAGIFLYEAARQRGFHY